MPLPTVNRMNNKTLSRSCMAIGICMLMGGAWAQNAAAPQPAPVGQAAAGQKIAQSGSAQGAAACAGCHGARGEGMAGFPALAGQHAGYLLRQLQHLADGSRQAPVMAPMAKALSTQERADVAAYYASLPLPIQALRGAWPGSKDDEGAWLVERGRWSQGIPACAQCHGPGGVGVGADFPAIGHLTADYMQSQIDAWNKGQREAGPLGLMGRVARKLTAEDIQAVAAYYRRQHGAAAPSAKP
jgi:cytochrome c553